MSKSLRFSNRLKDEKSPYLRQHSENPVDWYPWSGEALERAKKEDKPLIVSIGYSACHWCHVMEKESFEDNETARVMNENFINIKIDREERPDLDSLYMKAVQAMTGHGGWPLTVFASPDGVPFYGGSYFPPEDRFGLPGFRKVLFAVSLAYKKNRNRITAVTGDVEAALKRKPEVPVELGPVISDDAYDAARSFFDNVYGGFGTGTKFPHAMFLEFLLKFYRRTGRKDALNMVKKTLSGMASGGIYDHLGGGFHRYSVDEMWNVPHFEKMLYDNALLARLYAMAFEETGSDFYRDVSIDTLDYLLRDMRDPGGGFWSAQDADVDGKEGEYYLWGYEEVKKSLAAAGAHDPDKFIRYFSITVPGNFEGRNLLRISQGVKTRESPVDDEIKGMKTGLLKERGHRTAPQVDTKIITAWNGLAITALAKASRAFSRQDYMEEAIRCAGFVLDNLRDRDGRLYRYHLGGKADVKANLEDYAIFAGGLVSIYSGTAQAAWLDEARRLTDAMVELFYDGSEGLFYDTARDQERLFVRERDLYDNDVPSGNSAAVRLLLRVSKLVEKRDYRVLAEEALRSAEGIREEPVSYGNFLCALETLLGEKPPGHRQ